MGKDSAAGKNSASFRAEYYSINNEPETTLFSRRDFYKIWLINNDGMLTIGEQDVAVTRPALVFLNPLELYAFRPLTKTRTGYWCIFTEEFLAGDSRKPSLTGSALFKLGGGNVFYPDKDQLEVVRFLFERIVNEYNSAYIHKYQSIKNYTDLLIHEGAKMQPKFSGTQPHNAASRMTMLFLNLLEKQFPIASPREPLKLKKPGDYADELSVHVNHLNAVIQQVTGRSTRTHIADRMISEGKALLHFSDWSVADIAYSLGFEYPNHFNNFFKKHTGGTPLSLRK